MVVWYRGDGSGFACDTIIGQRVDDVKGAKLTTAILGGQQVERLDFDGIAAVLGLACDAFDDDATACIIPGVLCLAVQPTPPPNRFLGDFWLGIYVGLAGGRVCSGACCADYTHRFCAGLGTVLGAGAGADLERVAAGAGCA